MTAEEERDELVVFVRDVLDEMRELEALTHTSRYAPEFISSRNRIENKLRLLRIKGVKVDL